MAFNELRKFNRGGAAGGSQLGDNEIRVASYPSETKDGKTIYATNILMGDKIAFTLGLKGGERVRILVGSGEDTGSLMLVPDTGPGTVKFAKYSNGGRVFSTRVPVQKRVSSVPSPFHYVEVEGKRAVVVKHPAL